jgi:6-phosphogluconolactonase
MAVMAEAEDFVGEAVELIAAGILRKQAGGGTFRLCLCGGSTPAPIYRALSERGDIDWQRVVITFGDERCVGPEDGQSNYRMARESLLDPAGIPAGNVVRMEGELDPPVAAEKCEQRLGKLAAENGEAVFKHDLLLLGMGTDGHTASLFPGTEALQESERWVRENYVPSQGSWRLTMTYPLINAAEEVVFLVTGGEKRAIVKEIIAGGADYPAAKIQPDSGKITWMVGD